LDIYKTWFLFSNPGVTVVVSFYQDCSAPEHFELKAETLFSNKMHT